MEADRGTIRAVADDGHDLSQSSRFAFGEQRRHQLSADPSTGPCRVQVDRVLSGMAVSRPQAIGRRVGVAHDLSSALGNEIGKAPADDIEAPLPHVILARRLEFKRREPMKAVMRVDGGDRRNMTLLAGTNSDIGGRRLSAHRWICDPGALASARSTRVSCHASGSVSRTTAATSSITGVRPIASLNRPYRAGDNAPAPIVPV